jgi:aspartate/methionine/tyrosine aminotransferase
MERFSVEPFLVMEVLKRARELEREGKDVVHLEIGEPDFPPPERVKLRALEFLESSQQKYTETAGLPQLREAIARYYYSSYGVEVEPQQVVVTPGSSPAIMAVLKVVYQEFGELSYPDPGYPCYKNIANFLSLKARSINLSPESSFKVEPSQLETPVLIVNSPSNPTGVVYSKEELSNLAEKAFLVSDEIYHGLVYEGRAPSALEVTGNCAVVNGFSKFFLMTGWRVGWLLLPKELVPPVVAILQNTVISAPTLSQYAALSALEEEILRELRSRVELYRKRRDVLVRGLEEIGFSVPVKPQGAFYVFADASPFTRDSFSFAFELLEKALVAVTPGRDFGYNNTSRFIRFSFCTELSRIEEALERLYRYLR